MKRTIAAGTAFAAIVLIASTAAPAQPLLFAFTGLPGAVDTCKWFDDDLNADRSIDSLTRQTDLLYNRVALPPGENVTVGSTAITAEGGELVDYRLGSTTVCSTARAVYGPTPEPSPAP